MSLFDELKRRKVFKVGAAYLVVAWLAVQAASIGFPAFDAPPWALRIFILIALLGFPITVVMAWVFDFTPEGVKLDVGASGGKGLFAVAALLIVLALGWYFYGQPSFRKGDVATPSIADPNSIAVLPFANISGKADDEYLKGRALFRQRSDLPSAIAHLKAAVAKAPEFAAAWSSLSLTYEVSFWYTAHMTPAIETELLAGQAAAAERAAALEPDAATTEHALGNVARARFHYADAERHYLRAMQIDPSYSDVREDYSEVLYEVGRLEDSMRTARQLVTLDPY